MYIYIYSFVGYLATHQDFQMYKLTLNKIFFNSNFGGRYEYYMSDE